MNKGRVVITGVGVIAPNGIGKERFWQALQDGRSGIKPATSLDTTFFKTKLAGECSDFKAEDFLGTKGLRNLDRTTLLLCSSAKMALEDADISITDKNTDDIGVVTATTLSITWDLAKFTKEVVEEEPQFVNPALFPPTTMNFPSSQLSIRYKIKGFNTTISTGYTAGLDALKYAMEVIRRGRAKAVLVSGVESLSFSTFVGFYKIGFLAGLKGEEIMCPFDCRHNGIILSEGAASLIVEDEEYAKTRGVRIYAELLSVASYFDAYRAVKYDPGATALIYAMTKAIEKSDLGEEDIDYISSAANSVPMQDKLETMAIKKVFGFYAPRIPVSAIKSMIGESVSPSGCFQVISAIDGITKGIIHPTINYQEPDAECDLDYVPNVCRGANVRNVLINNLGPGGHNATAVVAKYDV